MRPFTFQKYSAQVTAEAGIFQTLNNVPRKQMIRISASLLHLAPLADAQWSSLTDVANPRLSSDFHTILYDVIEGRLYYWMWLTDTRQGPFVRFGYVQTETRRIMNLPKPYLSLQSLDFATCVPSPNVLFDTVHCGKAISSAVVDRYLALLATKGHLHKNRVRFESTDFSKMLWDPAHLPDGKWNDRLHSALIIIPVSHTLHQIEHWSLLVVNNVKTRMEIWDSLPLGKDKDAENVMISLRLLANKIQHDLHSAYKVEFPSAPNPVECYHKEIARMPCHVDARDSGIIMLSVAKELSRLDAYVGYEDVLQQSYNDRVAHGNRIQLQAHPSPLTLAEAANKTQLMRFNMYNELLTSSINDKANWLIHA